MFFMLVKFFRKKKQQKSKIVPDNLHYLYYFRYSEVSLYYVEWFVISWMICTYYVECVLTTLNVMSLVEWLALLLNELKWFNENSSRKIPRKIVPGFFFPLKILKMMTVPSIRTLPTPLPPPFGPLAPLVKVPSVKIALHQILLWFSFL